MARWKLSTAHYLNVPGEEWEYIETDRKTGRPRRTKFIVPRHLDPKDPTCWTVRWGDKDNADGEIIVCHEDRGEPGDQIFYGDPTPDMIPIDDEARELSASFESRWQYKPDTGLDPNQFATSLIDKFQAEMARPATPTAIEIPGIGDLAKAVAQMAEANQQLLSQIAQSRRV